MANFNHDCLTSPVDPKIKIPISNAVKTNKMYLEITQMSSEVWHINGWLRPHQTNRQQISDLFAIVDRDLADAKTARLSYDWQFAIAYNAAPKLCTILLYAEGYRAEKNLAHFRTLAALPLVLGSKWKDDAGRKSPEEAQELIEFAYELQAEVLIWLRGNRPELIGRDQLGKV